MLDRWKSRRSDAEEAEERERQTAQAAPFIDNENMLREEYFALFGGDGWKDKSRPLPELIAALQAQSRADCPAALCLSGGGIRSATFSLGVLQWLAAKRQLRDYHYLSTVSGGGYIGSFLVNGLRQASVRAQEEELDKGPCKPRRLERVGRAASLNWMRRLGQSAGTESGARVAGAARITDGGRDPVAPLRAFSNYLSPTGGLSTDAFALVAIFLRNLLLNLLVWLPVLAVLVALPRLYIAMLTGGPVLNPPVIEWQPLWAALPASWEPVQKAFSAVCEWWPLFGALLAIIFGIGYVVADLPPPDWRPPAPPAKTAPLTVLQVLCMPVTEVLARLANQLPEELQRKLPAGLRQQPQQPQKPSPVVPSNQFNLACFLPITGAALVLSLLGAWMEPLHKGDLLWFGAAGAIAHVLGIGVGVVMRRLRQIDYRPASIVGFLVVSAVGAVGGMLTWLVLSQLGQGAVAMQLTATQRLLYASFSVPALTGAFWLAMALHAGLMGRGSTEEDREWWARATAAWLKFTLIWVAAFGLLVWAPLLILEHAAEDGLTAVKFGVGGGTLGVVTALAGYWSKNGEQVKSRAKGVIDATGVKLLDLMAGAVLAAVLLALSLTWSVVLDRCHDWRWIEPLCRVDVQAQTDLLREQARLSAAAASAPGSEAVRILAPELDPISAEVVELGGAAGTQAFAHVLLHGSGWLLFAACVVLMAVAILMAHRMGANQFSLHGMYGNRLVRAYLGSGRSSRYPHWFTGFDPCDNPKLAEFKAPLSVAGRPRLFPLVNIALNLVKPSEKRLDWQQRKAASFFATPLHCGSAHLGFRPTKYYAGGMTLGRAMTISGAAASPNMGYHSSSLVTAVMTLFNVRLGWWSPNPEVNRNWSEEQPALGLDIMLAEAGGATGDEDNFVYLSDGGHFDNTGIYEMVRRRCRRIVLVDATCDGEFKWRDLLDIVRKIRVDFGVPIKFGDGLPGGDHKPTNPRRLTAAIQYSARDEGIEDGTLIVLKPMLLPGDPPELAAYARDSLKEGSPADDPGRFPHQSTADQFFDEQQFESYRLLGWITAEAALPPEPETKDAAPSQKPECRRPPSRQAGAGGFGELMQQMGTGMALATAITVGGTLGVIGTVALQPGEVSLSAEDRALLKGGLKGSVDGASLKLDKEDRKVLEAGVRIRLDEDTVNRLKAAVDKLEIALKAPADLNMTDGSAPSRGGKVELALDGPSRKALESLKEAIEKLATKEKDGSMQTLAAAITTLERTLGTAENPKLVDALRELKTVMESTGPRRNIRGQEGGQR